MSRMISVSLLAVLMLAAFSISFAGQIGDPPIIEDPPDPPLFGQHSQFEVFVDIGADSGSIRETRPDSIILVPVSMYASDTDLFEGLTISDFMNTITYDDELLELVGITSGEWDADSISVTFRTAASDLDTLEIEADADDYSWTFDYEVWDTMYYMEFRVLCTEDYEEVNDLDINSSDYFRNWVVIYGLEQYDTYANEDGWVFFDQEYWFGMHASITHGFLGSEIRIAVYLDSLNYMSVQLINYFNFNSTDFYISNMEAAGYCVDWGWKGVNAVGESLTAWIWAVGADPIGPVATTDTLYVLTFKPYNTAEPGDFSDLEFNPAGTQFFRTGSCHHAFELVEYDCTDGYFEIPDYELDVTMDFVGVDKEPGDYDTLSIYIENTFPLGLKPEMGGTGGDLQLLLEHTDLLSYESVTWTNSVVDLDIHAPNDEHVKIWLNPPDTEAGWFDSTSTPVELCRIEFQIASSGLGADPDLSIDLAELWGSYETMAEDTTGLVTLEIGDGITSTGDEIDLEVWQIWAQDASGTYDVYVPIKMTAPAETDSVYVHVTYSHPNLCIRGLTPAVTGLEMTSSYGNVYLFGDDLDVSEGSDITLGTIWFGSRNVGTIQQTITIYETHVLDGGDEYHIPITTNGTATITTDVLHKCPNINIEKAPGVILPQSFALHQNYPNPFNPITKINFDLPQSEWVRLEIFNILGQKVTTLLDTPMDAGYHEVEWDAGRENPSGVYFYTIQAGNFVESKKMMLLK